MGEVEANEQLKVKAGEWAKVKTRSGDEFYVSSAILTTLDKFDPWEKKQKEIGLANQRETEQKAQQAGQRAEQEAKRAAHLRSILGDQAHDAAIESGKTAALAIHKGLYTTPGYTVPNFGAIQSQIGDDAIEAGCDDQSTVNAFIQVANRKCGLVLRALNDMWANQYLGQNQ
jgi:hypothetical protein